MSPRGLNSPLPAEICDADGRLTAMGRAFLMKLWERTGYAPGIDSAWTALEADIAVLSAAQAQSMANAALAEAKAALELATQALLDAQSIRSQALKALEMAQDSTILLTTARPKRDGSQSDESMVFTIMKP